MKASIHHSHIQLLVALVCLITVVSCVTPAPENSSHWLPPEIVETAASPSLVIAAAGTRSAEELVQFFMTSRPDADQAKVQRMAEYYLMECGIEGINSDVAFVQMCLETGFLRFGGLVTEEMNNFCGLGAIDAAHPGNSFETEHLGVRAHVQHLKAYGSTEPLVQECIDPRYKWVTPKGKAPDVYGLAGTWASDPYYGDKLAALLERLGQM